MNEKIQRKLYKKFSKKIGNKVIIFLPVFSIRRCRMRALTPSGDCGEGIFYGFKRYEGYDRSEKDELTKEEYLDSHDWTTGGPIPIEDVCGEHKKEWEQLSPPSIGEYGD